MDSLSTIDHVCAVTGAASAHRRERVQSLWSGWGEIARYDLVDGPAPSVIVKEVRPPRSGQHPRGWDGDRGQARKVRSYEIEARFYEQYASQTTARVARVWSVEPGRFVLEDLDASGFAARAVGAGSLPEPRIARVLEWLADFHRDFLGGPATGLWPIGTYWHLATRPDEWSAMPAGPLREAAPALDAALSAVPSTLVHGDAKVANVCFGDSAVALVDFQYVGGGCGLKDVAYFLGSCLGDAALLADADRWLDHYFVRLNQPEVETAWRAVWPHAWADFERFLAGWAPQHWKRTGYAASMTARALAAL